jgi:[ribosomal protein S18]-alanine N-acetyltransferase
VSAVLKSPPPELRAMREDDLEQVATIEGNAYEFPWSPGIFRDCLRAGYGCWVLEEADRVIGYALLSVAAGEAHILNLCIDPAHQRRGLGRRMLLRLLDLARWHRAERVFLEVRPSNDGAITLYRREGFNEIGTRPRYYPARHGREDAVVMAMELLGPEDGE